jgi:hypothetical protein
VSAVEDQDDGAAKPERALTRTSPSETSMAAHITIQNSSQVTLTLTNVGTNLLVVRRARRRCAGPAITALRYGHVEVGADAYNVFDLR